MKKCPHCNQLKSLDEFGMDCNRTDRLNCYCLKCANELGQMAKRKYRSSKNGKETESKYDKKRGKVRRTLISNYKGTCGCYYCGETDYRVLHFDHIDPSEKEGNISKMRNYCVERFWEEANKCRVLCSDCHMLVTHKDTYDGDVGDFRKYNKINGGI